MRREDMRLREKQHRDDCEARERQHVLLMQQLQLGQRVQLPGMPQAAGHVPASLDDDTRARALRRLRSLPATKRGMIKALLPGYVEEMRMLASEDVVADDEVEAFVDVLIAKGNAAPPRP